jgi:hypothetical protein
LIGGVRYTSLEAIKRFLESGITSAREGTDTGPLPTGISSATSTAPSTRMRERQIAEAERELKQAGF